MLAVKKLPEVLGSILTDGVEGACLTTSDGSLLCSVSAGAQATSAVNETSFAAISSAVWGNYLQGCPDVSFTLLKLDNGCLGIISAGKGYLIAAYGRDVPPGLLRGKLESLSAYFERVFDQIK